MTSLSALTICFDRPLAYSTPTALPFSIIILVTCARVIAFRLDRFKAGFKNATAPLQRLLFLMVL